MSITGRTIDMIWASTLRRPWRRGRPRRTVRWVSTELDTGFDPFVGGPGHRGEGQEDVVERGAVQGEPAHPRARRVDLVEDGAHVGGAAVGGDAEREPGLVALDDPGAEPGRGRLERAPVGQVEV